MTLLRLSTPLVAVLLAIPDAYADEPNPARVDRYGDPLPPGAVARLGTMRLRYAACMAFSPDGKTLATAQDHAVHLWDTTTGKRLRRLTAPHLTELAYTIAFSPDGRKVAVMDNSGLVIVVWQVDKESPLFTIRIQGRRSYRLLMMGRIVFSPDSKTLYTGNDRTIHGWDATTGKETYQFDYSKIAQSRSNTVVFSGDGKRFATAGGSKGLVCLWDTQAGKLLHVLHGPRRNRVHYAAFSPDGRLLVAADYDLTVHLWDVTSGKEVRKLQGRISDIPAVAFTPDGKGLATVNRKRFTDVPAIHLWDLQAGADMPRKTIAAPGITALAYSPDGKTLAWICCGQGAHLLDATTGEERLPFDSHDGDVNAVAYSPNGRLIATASSDHTIRLWEEVTGKSRSILLGHKNAVNALAFSPDGKWLASGSSDGTAALWNVGTSKRGFVFVGQHNEVHAVAFAPDGQTLAVGGHNSVIQWWDVQTGVELRRINEDAKEFNDISMALAFSPDGRLLASAGDESLRLHDARSGRLLRTVKLGEPFVVSLSFSPDGRTLACGGKNRSILWELATGKERMRLPGEGYHGGGVAFSPEGKLLALGSHEWYDGTAKVVYVWELATGREPGAFRGHEQAVRGVAFSPDGKRLATASKDATALIWDLAAVAARGPHLRIDKRSLKSPHDAKDLEVAWKDLAGEDAVKAQQAVWMLAREPRQAAAFLEKHLRPASEPNAAHIAALLDDLDSDNFSKREQASAELTRLGTAAEPLVRKKHAEKIPLEMRKRIDLLLEKLDVLAPLTGEELRNVRAVEALESGGTGEARQLLLTLAKGSECARLTREAKASLQRLERHPSPNP